MGWTRFSVNKFFFLSSNRVSVPEHTVGLAEIKKNEIGRVASYIWRKTRTEKKDNLISRSE